MGCIFVEVPSFDILTVGDVLMLVGSGGYGGYGLTELRLQPLAGLRWASTL